MTEHRDPRPLEHPTPPQSEEQILDDLDYGAMEQDVFLLKAHLLNID